MKQIVLDFWNFVKKPKDIQYSGNEKAYKWKVLFALFVLNILITIVYLGLSSLISYFYPLEHKLENIDFGPILTFLLLVILIPLIEEIVFRLGLRREGIVKSLFTEEKWHRYFSIFTYLSVITFALMHGTNYLFDNYWLLLLVPLLTISQFFTGFINTYLRVRFNFFMGFAFHAFWNFTAIFLTSSAFVLSPKETVITHKNYELNIEEKNFLSHSSGEMLFTINNDTIYQLESKGFKLKDILESIDSIKMDFIPISDYVDINLKTNKGILKDSLLMILENEGYIEKKTQTN